MPVDAQVGDRPGDDIDDQHPRRPHGPLLASGGEPGRERGHETVAEVALGVLECVDHRLGHALVGEQIAGGDAAGALGRGMAAERALAGVGRDETRGVDARELAELRVRSGADQLRHRLGRREAAAQEVEQPAARATGR